MPERFRLTHRFPVSNGGGGGCTLKRFALTIDHDQPNGYLRQSSYKLDIHER